MPRQIGESARAGATRDAHVVGRRRRRDTRQQARRGRLVRKVRDVHDAERDIVGSSPRAELVRIKEKLVGTGAVGTPLGTAEQHERV